MNKRVSILSFAIMAACLTMLAQSQLTMASCGSVNCFLVIGSQAGIPQKGTVTTNLIYTNINQGDLLDGTTGEIPAIEVGDRFINLGEHRERSTRTQITTVDVNVGITDRAAIQITVPIVDRSHLHEIEIKTDEQADETFNDTGLGDIRLTGKYNVLTSLRNLVVLGLGIELPTGKTKSKADGKQIIQEPSLQIGRGNVGLIGSLYQAYELIPHRLNQFSSVSYRHTFRNNQGYQWGDEYILSAGLNLQTFTWLVLTGQFNWRYLVHDNFSGLLKQHPSGAVIDSAIKDRRVPTTGSTTLMFTPGVTVQNVPFIPNTAMYANVQIPVVRDFNNNLAQDVSFIFGITHFFNIFGNNG